MGVLLSCKDPRVGKQVGGCGPGKAILGLVIIIIKTTQGFCVSWRSLLNTFPQSFSFFFNINLLILFIYLWLHWVFVAARGLSLVAVCGLLIAVASLVAEHGLQGFSSCGMGARQLWLAGSGWQAQQLWCTGLVAPWHVGSSRTRARTRVPCIGRRILNHCATREVPVLQFFFLSFQMYFISTVTPYVNGYIMLFTWHQL